MAVSTFSFGGHAFEPLAERALHWPARRTVILSDLHVGKAAVFRARGLPVPTGVTTKDLDRLAAIVEQTAAERVLILGDFLHAKESHDSASHIERWRSRHASLAVEIVPGNHDKHLGSLDPALKFKKLEAVHVEAGLAFVHDPAEVQALPVLAGHVHPRARLSDFDGSGVSVPCFVVDERVLILPAFGSFTGGCRMATADGRRLLATAANRVVEVPHRPRRPIGLPAGGA
ncbi:MAG TPA: ligase-associated DNA damage response endonuclease PdeM [Tepidisphaeraceae bacterium]|jgi:DNA ligase-associated metallophosphoesterase